MRWVPLVKVGLVAGLVQVVAGAAMYLSGVYFERWSLQLMMLLTVASIAAGNWWYGKYVLGGQTTYWRALLVGVVMSVLMAAVYVTYNLLSVSFIYPHFIEDMVQAEFDQASVGLDPAQAGQLLRSLRSQLTLRNLAVGNFVGAFRFGTMASVFVAFGFLAQWRRLRRRSRESVGGSEARLDSV
jgi:hypothetical protein